MSEDKEASDAPELPADAQARIGARLRQMYDHVLQEPVPDRFAALLNQLQSGAPPGDASRDSEDNNQTDR